ncbi:MAG: carbohydrate porin [Nitrospira sp.]|nr:carbohydrate porin [Nitrospira sp.]
MSSGILFRYTVPPHCYDVQRRWRLANCVIGCLLVSISMSPSFARSEDSSGSNETTILDRWESFQATMNDHGVIFQTINTIDILSPVSGGVRRQAAIAGDLDLLLTLDGAQLLDWPDATLFVYGLGVYGDDPSQNVGDLQAVSSIAAPNSWKLYEFWYQQNFLQERFSLLAGLYDVTSEFDVIRSSSELFLNSSFGTGPEFATSGVNGPSTFPTTTLAVRGQAILSDELVIRTVVADGVPGNPEDPGGTQLILRKQDGVFINTELAFYNLRDQRRRDARKIIRKRPLRLVFQRVGRAAPMEYEGKYAIGLWGYTTDLSDLSEVDPSGNPLKRDATGGIYGLAEQIVFHETEDREQGLTLFARAGLSDPRVNRLSRYYGAGLVYRGLIPGRDADEIGLGVGAAFNGSHFKRAQQKAEIPVDNAEITVEMSYTINVREEIVVQPDLQYIMNPGTDPAVRNALVVGVRLELNLNWFEGPTTSVEILK